MRSFLTIAILPFIILSICSCSDPLLKEPEQVGEKVYQIAKRLNTQSKEEYIKFFLTVEEMRELGKNEELITEENIRNYLTSMSKDNWNQIVFKEYDHIISRGKEYKIDWAEIEYSDYTFKIDKEDGFKSSTGKLYFKDQENSYYLETVAIWNGIEYKIVEINGIYKP
jgi:hypothetical protein